MTESDEHNSDGNWLAKKIKDNWSSEDKRNDNRYDFCMIKISDENDGICKDVDKWVQN